MNNELNMNHSTPMTLKVGETVLIEMEDITVTGIVLNKTSLKMNEARRVTALYDIEHLAHHGTDMWEPTNTRFFQRTDGTVFTPKANWQLRQQVAEQTQKVRGL
jgi:hypothetical protein